MFEQFIGTKPVDQRLLFDVGALQSYLGDRVDLKAPVQVEQFRGGQSNPTYRLTAADGRRFVLRRKPPGTLLPSAHAVDREYTVTRALCAAGFPVARPYLLCQDDSIIGTAFLRSCTPSITARWGSRASAGRATISSARSRAGPSNTAPPRPSAFRRWTISWRGCRTMCRRRAVRPSCTATSVSTTRSFTQPSPGFSRCSTGSSRRWASRLPTSPITA